MLARGLLALLMVFSSVAHANESAQTIVHMLDYVSVDYPEFVKDGKVRGAFVAWVTGELTALGIVEVPEGMPLSDGANRARQAAITTEISEIVGGAEALSTP
mgnify:CR=1 FL=1